MNRYDPDHAPDPVQWLALDEQERIQLVEKHHRVARVKLSDVKAHAIFHTIVENQIAENLESVVRAMARLTAEGLSRHEAVHAIASVLGEQIAGLFNGNVDGNSAETYNAAVERLTAREWRGG